MPLSAYVELSREKPVIVLVVWLSGGTYTNNKIYNKISVKYYPLNWVGLSVSLFSKFYISTLRYIINNNSYIP